MVKLVSNLTQNQKVSCLVRTTTINNPIFISGNSYSLGSGRLGFLFIKVTDVTKTELKQCLTTIFYQGGLFSGDFTFYKMPSSFDETASASDLVTYYLNHSNLPIVANTHFGPMNATSLATYSFDITNCLINCEDDEDLYIWIAFKVVLSNSNQSVSIYDYQNNTDINSSKHSIAVICDNGQPISHNALQEYNCGSFDKGYLNLFNGQYYHLYNCYQSNSQKNPLSLSVCYNKFKKTKNSFIGNNIYFNYQFDIYNEDGGYIIEDYLGNRRFYTHITEDDDFDYHNRGVKHLDTDGSLYYCYEDASYFFLAASLPPTILITIHLYDNSDNHLLFTVDQYGLRLLKVYDPLGNETTLTWTLDTDIYLLTSVSNPSNSTISFHYTNKKMDYAVTNGLYFYFTNPSNSQFKISCQYQGTPVREFYFYKNGDALTGVKDSLSGNSLVLTTQSNMVTNVEGQYSNSYSYFEHSLLYYDGYTVLDNNEDDNPITFIFNHYGNIQMVMDTLGNVKSYNYAEITGEDLVRPANQQIEQNCRTNLITNHDFEFPTFANSGWIKTGSGYAVLSNEAISNKLCLKLVSESSTPLVVSQTIPSERIVTDKSYQLKLWLKGTNSSATNISIKAIKNYKTLVPGTSTYISHQDEYPVTISSLSTDWAVYSSSSFSFTSGETNRSITIELSIANKTLYIDDIQLEEIHHNRTDLLAHVSPTYSTGTFLQTVTSDIIKDSIKAKTYNHLVSNAADTSIGTYKKTISILGSKGDSYLFNIFAKCLSITTDTFKGYLKFIYYDNSESTYEYSFDNYCSNWQLLIRSVTAKKNYTSIEVGISFSNYLSFSVNAIQLYEQNPIAFADYSPTGMSSSYGDNSSISIVNDEGLLEASISSRGEFIKYSYNADHTLNKKVDHYHNQITYTYDSDKNVTLETFTNGTTTSTKAYNYTNNQLTSQTDEFNNTTYFGYNAFKYVNQITRPTHPDSTVISYSYNPLNNISQVLSSPHQHNLSYGNDKETLIGATNNNNLSYSYSYDAYHRLISVSLGTAVISSFTYPSVTNTFRHHKVLSKQYGPSGDVLTFSYDDFDRIISVSINNNLQYEYRYDEFGYVYQIIDHANNETSYYFYGSGGQLNKEFTPSNTITYKYDENGNVQQKVIYQGNDYTVYTYDYDYENTSNSREATFLRFAKLYDADLVYFPLSGNGLYGLSHIGGMDANYSDENIYADVLKISNKNDKYQANALSANIKRNFDKDGKQFSYNAWFSNLMMKNSFFLWFKPSGNLSFTTNINLITYAGIKFQINSTGNIVVYGLNHTTANSIVLDGWNFLYFNIDIANNTLTISLNGGFETFNSPFGPTAVSLLLHPLISLGDNESYPNDILPLSISYFALGINSESLTEDELSLISTKTKSAITNTSTNNPIRNIGRVKGNKSIEYIPLDTDFKSINGLKPNNFIYPEDDSLTPPSILAPFTTLEPRKSYKCYSSSYPDTYLSYSTSMINSGTVSLSVKTTSTSGSKYLFSLYRNNTLFLSFYVNGSKGYLTFGGTTTSTNSIILIKNGVYTITFSLNQAKIYKDGILILTKNLTDPSAASDTPLTLYVGQLGTDKATAYNGYINDVYFTPSILSATQISEIANASKSNFYRETFDKLGRLTQKNIPGSLLEYNHSYTYDKTRVSKEITYKNETLNYTYNAMGNVISITGNLNRTYSYDSLNRLTGVTSLDYEFDESFIYGNDNNITTHVFMDGQDEITHTFNYSNGKLISVTENNIPVVSISYNSSNPLYPSSITLKGTNKSLSWLGNRLIGIGNNISYSYNDQGIRTSKTVNNVTTQYRLEGNKIISLTKGNISLFFRYDFNGQLIGLSDGTDEYYYIRDILGNINGIVNSSNSYVVKYSYSAFGMPTINIQSGFESNIIALNNPFLFKGYYYDDETGLYYCNHRYYYPLICRWISPDSFAYLKPESLTGLNLYVYCENNPIMYVDENGNFPWLVIGLLVGSFAVGFGASVVSQGFKYGWDEINYWQAAVDGVFAAGATALSFTGIGAFASAGIGAAAGWSQYALGCVFHNESFTFIDSFYAIGVGFVAGAISGAGARNSASIAENMKLTGKGASAVKAITTASNRYIAGEISFSGFQGTANLWSKIAFNAVQNAIGDAFLNSLSNNVYRIVLSQLFSSTMIFLSSILQ